jgi:predicted PurR-regulated permease PerM
MILEKWQVMSQNAGETLVKIVPQLKQIGKFFLSAMAGLGGGLILFIVAIILSGVLLSYAEGGRSLALKFFKKLTGDKADEMIDLSVATIRSVMQGVIGVAVIQATLVGIGFFAAGVPGAPVLTMFVMVLTIVQIPPIIVVVPVIIYVYSTTATGGTFLVFAIWNILASLSDNVLKPMFLGRGMKIPMLVILIGAIGGMLAAGVIGLFVGPVILAVGYQLFQAWVNEAEDLNIIEEEQPPVNV